MTMGLNLVNVNKINNFVSGTYKGIGFSVKDGCVRIRNNEFGIRAIELETKIRKEILNMLVNKKGIDF